MGHVREAFLADFLRQRLGAAPVQEDCKLVSTGPEGKIGDQEEYDQVVPRDGGQTCTNVYQTDDVRLVRLVMVRVRWGGGKEEGRAGRWRGVGEEGE